MQHDDSVFLASRSCVTGFPHQLEWETSHTVADRTSTILVSRAHDTTSMCGHSENQPRNRDQSHVHEQTIFFMASDIQLLQSHHHGTEIRPQVFRQLIVPGGLTSARFSRFPGHPNRNTQPSAQVSFVSRP